jgi:hypothetical protein
MGLYLYALVALVSAIATWQVQNWRFHSLEEQRVEMQAKEEARKADRVDKAAVAHEQDKKQIETKYVVITKEVEHEVEKPVYRDACLPDSGVRIVNDHIQGKAPSEPAPAVSGPPAAR